MWVCVIEGVAPAGRPLLLFCSGPAANPATLMQSLRCSRLFKAEGLKHIDPAQG